MKPMLATPALNFNPMPIGRLVLAGSRRRQWAETDAKIAQALKDFKTRTRAQRSEDARHTLQRVCMARLRAERKGKDLSAYPVRRRGPGRYDWFQTFTGLRFYPKFPTREMFRIEDIAKSLSQICRFNGHIRTTYSVAQHSLHVSSMLPERLKFQGLMHDAAEAYLGDVVKPLKELLPDYRTLERNVWHVIARKFGVPERLDRAVKEADLTALATERRDLYIHPYTFQWRISEDAIPATGILVPLTAAAAEAAFLAEFKRLSKTYVQQQNCKPEKPC